MLKEDEVENVVALSPPIWEYLKSFWDSLLLVLSNPELMAIIAIVSVSSALVAALLWHMVLWFRYRRRRKKGLWMSDQERWDRLHREVADVVRDKVWDDYYCKGLISQQQMEELFNRLADAMKSKQLQTKKKSRGPLTAGYQQRLCWTIKNRLASVLYRMADGVSPRRVILPGDPPPQEVGKKPAKSKGKLSLKQAM